MINDTQKTLILEYAQFGLKGINDKHRQSTLTDSERQRMSEIREELGMEHQTICSKVRSILMGEV